MLKMKYLVVPLVGLLVLRVCVGLEINEDCQIIHDRNHMRHVVDASYGPKRLFLMPSIDSEHETMNEKLIKWGTALGFIFETVYISSECDCSELTNTENLSKYYDVINLKVKNIPSNYFENTEGLNKLSPVGDTVIEVEVQEVCKSTNITKNTNDVNYEICERTTQKITRLYGKLISNNIKSYIVLYDLINIDLNNLNDAEFTAYLKRYQKLIINGPIKKDSIVICIQGNYWYKWMKDFEYGLNTGIKRYHRHIIYACDNVNEFIEHDALAVIAPKPFKKEEHTFLPVVFYDDMTPFLLPKDKVVYPNSATLYGNYFEEMSHRLLQFIRLQSWNRVAIVSDDSLYSQDFEELMTNLFDTNGLVYSAHQCSGRTCNFAEALKWLKDADARIIIANVDGKYARKLMDTAKNNSLTTNEKVLWIFPDWSLEEFRINDIADTLSEMLYITVAPEQLTHSFKEEKTKRQIFKALSYFENAIYSHEKNEVEKTKLDQSPQNRISTLMKDIEKLQKRPVVFVRRIKRGEDEVVFDSTNQQKPFFIKVGYVDQEDCSLRGFGYAPVCEDGYPLLILLVILVFLLAVLCIIIFFRKCSPRGRNYRPF